MATTKQTRRQLEKLRRSLEKVTDAQTRDLTAAWVLAWNEVEPDLRAVLQGMLVAGETITRAELLRSERLRKVLVVISDHLDELAGAAGERVIDDLRGVIDAAGGAQASIIDSQLPPKAPELVDLDTWSRVDERQIAAIVRRTTEEITSATRPLSAEASRVVRSELIRGVAVGSNPRVTARRMIDRAERGFNGGLSRALTIARTETVSAHREAARIAQLEHRDVLSGWRWLVALSSRTCPACLSMGGRVFSLQEAGPSGHPNCRCAREPVLKPWSDLGISIDEPADVSPDPRAWFDAQPESIQVAIMGRERLDLLKAGQVDWDDLASLRHNPGWRDSYQVTPLRTLRAAPVA